MNLAERQAQWWKISYRECIDESFIGVYISPKQWDCFWNTNHKQMDRTLLICLDCDITKATYEAEQKNLVKLHERSSASTFTYKTANVKETPFPEPLLESKKGYR